MDRFDDLVLISTEIEHDEIMQEVEKENERVVPCTIGAVSRQEWASAGQQGLKPECVCILNDSDDYQKETKAKLGGERYAIYRTYLRNDGGIELYLRKDVGV